MMAGSDRGRDEMSSIMTNMLWKRRVQQPAIPTNVRSTLMTKRLQHKRVPYPVRLGLLASCLATTHDTSLAAYRWGLGFVGRSGISLLRAVFSYAYFHLAITPTNKVSMRTWGSEQGSRGSGGICGFSLLLDFVHPDIQARQAQPDAGVE